jgi:hypothetical protein
MQSSIPAPNRAKLAQYVYEKQPFGPPDATTVREPDCAAVLYEWNNNAFADLLKGSHIIVGRRGSGKSHLLGTFHNRSHFRSQLTTPYGREYRNRYHIDLKNVSNYDIILVLDMPNEIFELGTAYRTARVMPPVELLAKSWSQRIWLLLGQAIRTQDLPLWSTFPDAVKEYANPYGLARTGLSPDEYIRQMQEMLIQTGVKCVILIDNPEDFAFTELQNTVLAGLVKAVQDFISAQRSPVDVKMCIPGELFEFFSTRIANSDKDLHTVQYLNWKPEELMRIAAHRLTIYLQVYDEQGSARANILHLSQRDAIHKFWRNYLPPTVTNHWGFHEDTFRYILRHTYLLPRQVLTVLNTIAQQQGPPLFSSPFSEEAVRKGVQLTEAISTAIILKMFRIQFPEIDQIFAQIMPRLTPVFEYGLLRKVWHESARRPMSRMGKPEFWLFWRMMLMTGAIGVVDETESANSDAYIIGHFEFNSHHPLHISDKDRLCVHPMFSAIYNVHAGGEGKVILPRGAEMAVGD